MEIAVDELLVVEEALFTIVTNKKSKGKKRPFFSTNTPVSSKNVPSLTIVVSRALSSSQPAKTATAKSIPVKIATLLWVFKQIPKSFAQVACSGNSQPTPRFALASAYPGYKSLLYLGFCGLFLSPLNKQLL